MAKCPFCGGRLGVVHSIVNEYFGECKKGCFITKRYKTKKEALSAASKRFTPKRTVEDICAGVAEFVETNKSAVALMKKDGVLKGNNDEYLLAIMCHRIADFIYGDNKC